MTANKMKMEYCIGSLGFDPSLAITDIDRHSRIIASLNETNDFEAAIRAYFHLPDEKTDDYVYHAVASVSLRQIQRYVDLGGAKGLRGWYGGFRPGDEVLPPPTPSDIESYTSLFLPTSNPTTALRTFGANAKKGTLREFVAEYLTQKRFVDPGIKGVKGAKGKKVPMNPYLDFWAWAVRNLEFCGPLGAEGYVRRGKSHPLAVGLMHHFGCAVPTHEAIMLLKDIVKGREVVDVGSGGGYWTFMLRQYSSPTHPLDNHLSLWRTTWIPDTIPTTGTRWLSRSSLNHKDLVLLLVYPIVGGAQSGIEEGSFTRDLFKTYKGDTVAVVGTQNHNGYTGFRNMTFDEFMEREHKGWRKLVQIPLPSFPGKDDALFVYQKQ